MNKLDFVKQLKKHAQSVIDWNLVACGGVHDLSESKLKKQFSFVQSEAEETITRGFLKGDVIEVIDGAADVFVTASYAMFLDLGEKFDIEAFDHVDIYPESIEHFKNNGLQVATDLYIAHDYGYYLTAQVNDVFLKAAYVSVKIDDIATLLYIGQEMSGIDADAALSAVMASNWTKFFNYDTKEDLDEAMPGLLQECDLIVTRDKLDTKVSPVVCELNGSFYVALRDHEGAGKVRKPFKYVPPKLVALSDAFPF